MQASKNTILITGGASGIGLALATRLLKAGNAVVVCGRREEKLREAKAVGLQTRVCDLSSEGDRITLVDWAIHDYPKLNILINNAGIQRRVNLLEPLELRALREEIVTNFEAPVHLTNLLIPHLRQQRSPLIVNVTSGLSFAPLANVPVYSATKAAFHSFTLSLRHQLAGADIGVVEIIPPAVNTDLGGVGFHTFGVPLDEFADSVVERMMQGEIEIPYGTSTAASQGSREELEQIFGRLNSGR